MRCGGITVLVDILVEHVDLPQRAIRIVHPELGLSRVTALDAILALSSEASRLESSLNFDELLRVAHAEAGVIEVSAGCWTCGIQRQHQRRFGEVELGVIGSNLRRFGAKQYAIERDGPLQVRDIE